MSILGIAVQDALKLRRFFCYTAHSCTDKADLLTKYLIRTSNFLSLQSLLRKTEMRIESIPYSILVFSEIAVFRLLSRPKCAYTLRKAVCIFYERLAFSSWVSSLGPRAVSCESHCQSIPYKNKKGCKINIGNYKPILQCYMYWELN